MDEEGIAEQPTVYEQQPATHPSGGRRSLERIRLTTVHQLNHLLKEKRTRSDQGPTESMLAEVPEKDKDRRVRRRVLDGPTALLPHTRGGITYPPSVPLPHDFRETGETSSTQQ